MTCCFHSLSTGLLVKPWSHWAWCKYKALMLISWVGLGQVWQRVFQCSLCLSDGQDFTSLNKYSTRATARPTMNSIKWCPNRSRHGQFMGLILFLYNIYIFLFPLALCCRVRNTLNSRRKWVLFLSPFWDIYESFSLAAFIDKLHTVPNPKDIFCLNKQLIET